MRARLLVAVGTLLAVGVLIGLFVSAERAWQGHPVVYVPVDVDAIEGDRVRLGDVRLDLGLSAPAAFDGWVEPAWIALDVDARGVVTGARVLGEERPTGPGIAVAGRFDGVQVHFLPHEGSVALESGTAEDLRYLVVRVPPTGTPVPEGLADASLTLRARVPGLW